MARLSELKKALLQSGGDGAALNPYDLDPMLHEELLNLQPLFELMSLEQATGKTHEFSVRSSHPQAWFEGEATPMNQASSVYARKSTALKIQRIWGGVTGFAQAVDEAFIDALSTEIIGSLEGMSDVFEYGVLHGISNDIGFTGDAYQFSGLLPRVYADAATNVVDAGGNKVTLDDLDAVMAVARKHRQTRRDPYLWLMGLRMKQVVDGLQTKIQLPLSGVELLDGRVSMAAYGGHGIFETDFLVPDSTSTSPSDLAATPAAGGSLVQSTAYKYRIASVTITGEQVAAAEADGTTGVGETQNALAWTADSNAKAYMIFRRIGTGTWSLLDIIPALTYDSAGTVNGSVEAYTDNGTKTLKAIKPLETGEQQIAFVNMNPERGPRVLGKVDDMGRPVGNVASFVELARVKDSYDYMVKAYLGLKVPYVNLIGVLRHVKIA